MHRDDPAILGRWDVVQIAAILAVIVRQVFSPDRPPDRCRVEIEDLYDTFYVPLKKKGG